MNERLVCNAVSPEKDVDGFNVVNVGRFCSDLRALVPATPLGVIELIKRTGMCEGRISFSSVALCSQFISLAFTKFATCLMHHFIIIIYWNFIE